MPLSRTALWIALSIFIVIVVGYALWTRLLFPQVIRVDCQSIPLLGVPFSISCVVTRLTAEPIPATVCWDVEFPCTNGGALMSHACLAVPERFGAITNHLMPSVTPKPGIQCSMVSNLGGHVTNIAWAPLDPAKADAIGKVQHEAQEVRTVTEAPPMKPPLRNYQAELQAKIKDAWSIPPGTKGLQAVFLLRINRAGQVEQARLVRGSGNALFDESLQRAIKQAQPLPSLPEDFTNRTLDVTLTFRDSGR